MVLFIDAFLKTLLDFGLAEILTLLMMVTISYAVLTKSKIFGDANKSEGGKFTKHAMKVNAINMVLSLILGFLVFLSPFGKAIDIWFTKFFLHTLIILATVLGIYLMSGMIGFRNTNPTTAEEKAKRKKFDNIILGVSASIVLLIFINVGGLQMFGLSRENPIIGILGSPETWNEETVSHFAGATVVIIIFLGSLAALGFGSGIIKTKTRAATPAT